MLTLIALSAALFQEPPAPPAPPEVRTRIMLMGAHGPGGLDKDGDGQITREEFAAPMNDHFARMDANSDGRLSTEELSAGHVEMAGEDHDMMMRHGPGGPGERHVEMYRVGGGEPGVRVERVVAQTRFVVDEPGADGRRAIMIMGGPGNGEVRTWTTEDGREVRVETQAIFLHGGPGAPPHPMPPMPPMPPHAPGAGHGPGVHVFTHRLDGPGGGAAFMEGPGDLDKDGDGRITEAEFLAPMREAFAKMDADGSGALEAGERGTGDVRVIRMERQAPAAD